MSWNVNVKLKFYPLGKGPLLDLTQFLTIENPLKMIKKMLFISC